MKRPFNDYFIDQEEYPSPSASMLPLGVLYSYISTTFLNGWINYVKIISVRLISRYQNNAKNKEEVVALIARSPVHCDFSEALSDDVLILAKGKNRQGTIDEWWFFWFDRDCSDSCIGRFSTSDTDTEVIASFAAYAEYRSQNMDYENSGYPAIEIPPAVFTGWIRG